MDASTVLTIKEFSKLAGVHQTTLRYYDDIGLLLPAKRGDENNYRYYTLFQLTTLKLITVLVSLGVPLSVIQEMVKGRTPESVIEMISRQESILDRKLHELQAAYSVLHTFRKNMQNGLTGKAGEIRLEDMEDTHLVLGPENRFKSEDESFHENFLNFCHSANEYRVNLDYPIGGYHYNMASFLDNANHPDKFFSLDPLGNCTREAGKYLVGYNGGYDGDFRELARRMAAYAQENELEFVGPVYVVYLLDEISIKEPERYLARISVHVKKKKESYRRKNYSSEQWCPVKSTCVNPQCMKG